MKTILLVLGAACATASAATFIVTSTDDSGAGTFRQALLDLNSSDGPHVIEFNIPGDGPHVIAPASPLPWLSPTVTINGYSQPGASPNTLADGFDGAIKIRIDGAGMSGPKILRFTGDNNLVRGIALTGGGFARSGIDFRGSNNRLVGCLVGITPAGPERAVHTSLLPNPTRAVTGRR